jgi:DNA polymerase family B
VPARRNASRSRCAECPTHCRHHTTPEALPRNVDDLLIAANGVAFTSPRVRPGVLPRLLREILETRVMVKGAMKSTKRDRVLQRCFNARQFALKLIANVTYGYTAAGAQLACWIWGLLWTHTYSLPAVLALVHLVMACHAARLLCMVVLVCRLLGAHAYG